MIAPRWLVEAGAVGALSAAVLAAPLWMGELAEYLDERQSTAEPAAELSERSEIDDERPVVRQLHIEPTYREVVPAPRLSATIQPGEFNRADTEVRPVEHRPIDASAGPQCRIVGHYGWR